MNCASSWSPTRSYIEMHVQQNIKKRDTTFLAFHDECQKQHNIQDDTKKRGLLKNPTKIEEIQEKKIIDRN